MSIATMTQRLATVFNERQAGVLAEVISASYDQLIKVSDFNELKGIVKNLALAQERTEQRLEALTTAQERTEQRVEALAVGQERLTAAQERTEQRLEILAIGQERLTAAQERTEQRLEILAMGQERLTAAQERTEQEVRGLTAAHSLLDQRMTELAAALRDLTLAHQDTREQLGGLSQTVGYTLENEAFKALPALLQRDHALTVQGRLKRGYIRDNRGRDLEVNILGTGIRDGQPVHIIGESKAHLSKNKVDQFMASLQRCTGVFSDPIFPILVTHMVSGPDVEAYAQSQGIAVYFSYDF